MSYDDVIKCLKFVCYNYHIQYDYNTYRQIKGCPMGARFSPPFAIIYMYHVEKEAINILEKNHNIIPDFYARYIDDIIVGPFLKTDQKTINTINKVFNSVSADIKFTTEVPKDNFLNFLDVSIGINQNQLEYKWYAKDTHSGISLHKESWVPHHMKTNYM